MAGDQLRFYTDENISRAVIRGLRRLGADVLSTPEADMLGETDDRHLELANRLGRVLITHDPDFLRLDSQGFPHSGIVIAPEGTSISRMIAGLTLIYEIMEPDDMIGRVEYI